MNDNIKHIANWILEADLTSMQAAMEAGLIRSEDLVQVYLERIDRHDAALRCILEINLDAIAQAQALDEERRVRGSRGPLHGIPILLKDNIDTHDKMHTSAGSIALEDSFAPEDSFVAAQLRAAGAVLIGKTNMTEWANFMSSTMWAGYSSRGGLTLNPYGPGELFVGGSSSGSAVAVTANFAAAAIGTETSGSIISPSSQNGIVGLKPTVGLVSRSGIIPISQSQDSAGPMTRTVADAAILLSAITGVDDRDPVTITGASRAYNDYTPFLDADYLKQARIGIPRFYYKDLDPDRLNVIEDAIAVLRQAGAAIVDPVEMPCERAEWDTHVLRHEFKHGLNAYLERLPADVPIHSLAELIEYNSLHADTALKYGQNILQWCDQVSGTLDDPAYLASREYSRSMSREFGIDYALQQHQLDALLFLGNEGGADLAARAGYPCITVPGGYAEAGIIAPGGYTTKGPQGITFVGTAFSEPTLFKLAYGFEQATRHRRPPQLT